MRKKELKDYLKIDFIGRYARNENGGFTYHVSRRVKEHGGLLKEIADEIATTGKTDAVRAKHKAIEFGAMEEASFYKIGSIKWDILGGICTIKLSNKNDLCLDVPIQYMMDYDNNTLQSDNRGA